jgi:hypothetical protein
MQSPTVIWSPFPSQSFKLTIPLSKLTLNWRICKFASLHQYERWTIKCVVLECPANNKTFGRITWLITCIVVTSFHCVIGYFQLFHNNLFSLAWSHIIFRTPINSPSFSSSNYIYTPSPCTLFLLNFNLSLLYPRLWPCPIKISLILVSTAVI